MGKQKQLHWLKVLNTGRETLICYLKINFYDASSIICWRMASKQA